MMKQTTFFNKNSSKKIRVIQMVCYLVPYRYNHNLCGYMPFLHALPLHIHKYNIQAFDAYIKQQVILVALARLYDFILY